MAVTVEGTFRIVDRASRTLRDIAKNAELADREVQKLGRHLDEVSAKRNIDGLKSIDTRMREVSKSTTVATRELDKQTRVMDRHRRETDRSGTALERFGKKMILVFGGLGKVFSLLKWPAMIGGVSQLIPLIAALGAGVTALLPKLGQLAGVMGALPATFAGMGLAMVTVKLAFSDLQKAMGGNAQALARLTPEARRFTETLKSWKPLVDQFRQSAQRGLFGGLDASLERLRLAAPTVNRLLSMMGTTLGNLARQAANRFTDRGFLNDLLGIGNQGGRIVSRAGRGLMNLADALRHVAVAARPFTDWLTITLYRWTRWIDQAAKAGRETGRLRAFFDRTRTSLEQMGRILQNVYFAMRDLLRAASPLGESLWSGIERATKAWRDFQSSVAGQVATRRFFDSTLATLGQMWGLVQDISKALGRLAGNQQGAAGLVATLRQAIPPLERILENFQKAFGPEAGALIANIARTLELLSGNMVGPFTVALRLLNGILTIFNRLLGAVPALGQAILVAFAVSRIMRMAAAVRTLAGSWGLVTVSATRAAEAEAVATTVGGGGGFLGGLFRRGRGRGRAGGGAVGGSAMFDEMAMLESTAGAGGTAAAVGRFAPLVRGVGKVAVPIALGMAALDAYGAHRDGGVRNQIAQTGSAVLHGATFGFTPLYLGAEQERQERLSALATSADRVRVGTTPVTTARGIGGRGTTASEAVAHRANQGSPIYAQSYSQQMAAATSMGNQEQQITMLMRLQARVNADARGGKANADVTNFLAGLSQELSYRREILATTKAQEKADKRARDAEYGAGLNAARTGPTDPDGRLRSRGGTRRRMGAATTLLLRRMTTADPAEARTLGLQAMAADTALLKAHPELKGQVDRDQKMILAKFDQLGIDIKKKGKNIVDNTAAGVAGLAAALAKPGEQVAQLVDRQMTVAEQKYLAHMASLGYTSAQAKAFVKSGEATGTFFMGGQGPGTTPSSIGMGGGGTTGGAPAGAHGPGRARGGRIAGRGLMDTVPIAPGQLAAPGELVVNRHTERKVDALLGRQGTLGRLVGGETRPHHAPIAAKSGIMPGLATGGRVEDMITQVAGQFGLDPLAWASILWHESGLNPSSIGDHGTSFGLAQLHIGGALGNMSVAQARQYLDPMLNLQFAGRQMAGMGLSGLTGPAAVSAYSRIFERPADPGAEIADAMRYYNSHGNLFSGTGPHAGAPAGGGGGSPLMRAISAASGIDAHHYPYVWGGGHGAIGVPNGGGFDCSGSTSAVLGAAGLLSAPMVAASFMHWGVPGYDPNGINVVASPSHVYMMLNGRAFGTSSANPGGGAGWFSGGIRPGFVVNHVANPGAASVAPLRLAATSGGLTGQPGGLALGATGGQAAALNAAAARADGGLGFATGGRVRFGGWFGSGGTITASRPTLVGIGDSGTETATITRGGRGGGGHSFSVHIGNIVNHGGDVRREIEAAFDTLARKLETQGMVDDSEVLV